MGRPPFAPDDEQADTLRELGTLARRIERQQNELDRIVVRAKLQEIPIEVIARESRLSKKTVYRRLQP